MASDASALSRPLGSRSPIQHLFLLGQPRGGHVATSTVGEAATTSQGIDVGLVYYVSLLLPGVIINLSGRGTRV